MNKIEIIIAVLILILFVLLLVATVGYYNKHKCDNPYYNRCVKSHTETKVVVRPITVNGSLQVVTAPVMVTVCEEYVEERKPGC